MPSLSNQDWAPARWRWCEALRPDPSMHWQLHAIHPARREKNVSTTLLTNKEEGLKTPEGSAGEEKTV